jgi:hypothetical protein
LNQNTFEIIRNYPLPSHAYAEIVDSTQSA